MPTHELAQVLAQAVHLLVGQLAVGPAALQEVGVLRSLVLQRLDLRADDGERAVPEDRGDLRHDHRNILREGDKDHGALVVQVVAEADLIAEADIDHRDVQRARLEAVQLEAEVGGVFLRLLPDLLRVLVPQAEVHCLVHIREEPLLTDKLLQLRLPQGLVHAIADHRERHLDAAAPEVGDDVVDDMASGAVDGHHGRHLEHEVLRRVHLLKVAHVGEQHVLDEGGVREVHRRADAADEDVGDEGAAAFLLHVAVDRGARDAPEDRELRAHGFIDDDHQGQRHGHEDAHQHAEEQRSDERDHPKQEVVSLDAPQALGLTNSDERDHRVQHNRRQNKLGQIVEEGREEHQGAEHD
mmetsp:Transcript_39829/g.115240  ORF Transcript_39829/g.115240 Transcript_39829/m.115240 type:complete len:354 (+) Transcript_39829:395-1456(+)